MRDRYFIDSNIFLYAFSDIDKEKQKISIDIIKSGVISTQVINEVSNNLLKKFGFNNHDIVDFVRSCYRRYEVFNVDNNIFIKACLLRDSYNFSYYDSLIVSASIISECDILYSEDMQNLLKVENKVTIINPFKRVD